MPALLCADSNVAMYQKQICLPPFLSTGEQMLHEREGTDFIFPFDAGDRMIFAKNNAEKIHSPEAGGKIQVSVDSDLSPDYSFGAEFRW